MAAFTEFLEPFRGALFTPRSYFHHQLTPRRVADSPCFCLPRIRSPSHGTVVAQLSLPSGAASPHSHHRLQQHHFAPDPENWRRVWAWLSRKTPRDGLSVCNPEEAPVSRKGLAEEAADGPCPPLVLSGLFSCYSSPPAHLSHTTALILLRHTSSIPASMPLLHLVPPPDLSSLRHPFDCLQMETCGRSCEPHFPGEGSSWLPFTGSIHHATFLKAPNSASSPLSL